MALFGWLKNKKTAGIENNNDTIDITAGDALSTEESAEKNAVGSEDGESTEKIEESSEQAAERRGGESTKKIEESSEQATEQTAVECGDKASDALSTEESIEKNDEHMASVEDKGAEGTAKGFFAKIKQGLAKTRNNIMESVGQVLKGFSHIDEELYEELEEALIMADIGVDTSVEIIDRLKDIIKKERVSEVGEVKSLIQRIISDMLKENDNGLELPHPSVVLVIGVNGVGKTTTIGKLAHSLKSSGKTVLLAAADTFRAAAIDQLEVWGERNGVDVIKHQENSDPAAVVFDAVQAAKSRNIDVLICDTAGRLHNKKNLMQELEKIARIIKREYEQAKVETLLVLDAATGQNALQQAKLFKEAADITGIILTKLDGTAKGGIVISIKNELNVPVRYIGIGEGIDDLRPFDAQEFAAALFDTE